MTVASFSAHCGSDFCDALWVSRMVRRCGDGPGLHAPAGLMVVARYLMRAASGQAAAKARRMRDAVSIIRALALMSRRRMVAGLPHRGLARARIIAQVEIAARLLGATVSDLERRAKRGKR